MILTPDELQALTARRRSDAQRRELVALGVPFRARTDGSLVVLRSDLERRQAGGPAEPPEPQIRLDPPSRRRRTADLTPEEKERAKLRDSRARVATARKAAVAAGLRKA